MAASIALAAMVPFGASRAGAYPITTPAPGKTSTPSPTPTPSGIIPYGSMLAFTLDDPISSNGSHSGQMIRAHLKEALVLDGRSIAPEGTPVQIRIINAVAASNPDIYGYVDIYFEPLQLPNGQMVPLEPPTSHLTVNVSAGHESTVGVEDTIGDIFIPGHILYHVFRKGRNLVMQPGAEIHARTQATIALTRKGAVAVTTPAPVVVEDQSPVSTFRAVPFATPRPTDEPLPHGRTTLPPKPTPSPSLTPLPASPFASPSPSAT
jgi:hypothetical protein